MLIFDLKLQKFKQKIMVQVVGILMPFLAFSMAYNHYKTHNMLVIMFDFRYKNMKCIQNFVGNSIVAKVFVEYNFKIMCSLSLQVYNQLNPTKN